MTEVNWETGRITDEALAFMRAHIGKRAPVPAWNSEVTADNIWHFALGVGDDNPLWWDDDYAKASPWGARIAPPTYLYSHASGIRRAPEDGKMAVEEFLPGVLGLWAGERWRWERPARAGEKIRADAGLVQVDLNENGKFGGRSVRQVEHMAFRTDSGELVAEVWHIIKRFQREDARGKATYLDRPLAVWTAEDRARFDAHYEIEAKRLRRGPEPRFIEDVQPNDPIGPMLKGPLTINNIVGFIMGWGSGLCPTNRMMYDHLKLHPAIAQLNLSTGVMDNFESPHWEQAMAQQSGLASGYDFGCQRYSWFCHLITDWMGDAGFLEDLDFRLIRPNFLGDVTWLNGTVQEVDLASGVATVRITTTNQLDETTAAGVAKVRLPRRAG